MATWSEGSSFSSELSNEELRFIRGEDDPDVWDYVSLAPTVALKTGYDVVKLGTDLYDWTVDNEESTLDDYWTAEARFTGRERSESEKITGEFMSLITGTLATGGVLTGLTGLSKASRLGKMARGLEAWKKGKVGSPLLGKVGYQAVEGGISDSIFVSTGQGRLSNLLRDTVGFEDAFTEFLQHNEDDEAIEQRFKNFLEGAFIGGSAELATAFVMTLAKSTKNSLKVGNIDEGIAKAKMAGIDYETKLIKESDVIGLKMEPTVTLRASEFEEFSKEADSFMQKASNFDIDSEGFSTDLTQMAKEAQVDFNKSMRTHAMEAQKLINTSFKSQSKELNRFYKSQFEEGISLYKKAEQAIGKEKERLTKTADAFMERANTKISERAEELNEGRKAIASDKQRVDRKINKINEQLGNKKLKKAEKEALEDELVRHIAYDSEMAHMIKTSADDPEVMHELIERMTTDLPKQVDNILNSNVLPKDVRVTGERVSQAITEVLDMYKIPKKYSQYADEVFAEVVQKGGFDAMEELAPQMLKGLRKTTMFANGMTMKLTDSMRKLDTLLSKGQDVAKMTEGELLEVSTLMSRVMKDMMWDTEFGNVMGRGFQARGANGRTLYKEMQETNMTAKELADFKAKMDDDVVTLLSRPISKRKLKVKPRDLPEGIKHSPEELENFIENINILPKFEKFKIQDVTQKKFDEIAKMEAIPKSLKGTNAEKLIKAGHNMLQDPDKLFTTIKKLREQEGNINAIKKIIENDLYEAEKGGFWNMFTEFSKGNKLQGVTTKVVATASMYSMISFKAMQEYMVASMNTPARLVGLDGAMSAMDGFRKANRTVQGMLKVHKDVLDGALKGDFSKMSQDLTTLAQRNAVGNEMDKGRMITSENLNKILGNVDGDKPMINAVSSIGDFIGKWSHINSFGALTAIDNVGGATVSNGVLAGEAFEIGTRNKWSPMMIDDFQDSVIAKLKDSSLEHPNGMVEKEINRVIGLMEKASKEVVFQQELEGIPAQVQRILKGDSLTSRMMDAFLIPFWKTPVNITLELGRTVPVLRNYSSVVREALESSDKVVRDQMKAKLVLSNYAYSIFGGMALDGMITGRHPAEKRKRLLAEGIPEYSIKLPNGTYYQYNRFDPIGGMMGITADAINYSRDGDLTMGTIIAGTNVINKNYMQGLEKFRRLITDPEQNTASFVASELKSIVTPFQGLQRSVTRFTEEYETEYPVITDFRSFIDASFSDWVGAEKTHKLDIFGDEILRPDGVDRYASLFGANAGSKQGKTSANIELLRLNAISPDGRQGKISDIELTEEEYTAYRKKRKDLGMKDVITSIVNSPDYRKLSDGLRQQLLRDVVGDFKKSAKELFIAEDAGFRDKLIKKQSMLLQELLYDSGDDRVGTEYSDADLMFGTADRGNALERLNELL